MRSSPSFGRAPTVESGRHRQCAKLICLQGNLLSKHDIARDQIPFGHKTPANYRTTILVDLVDVRRGTVADAVPLSAVATDDTEMSNLSLVSPADQALGNTQGRGRLGYG